MLKFLCRDLSALGVKEPQPFRCLYHESNCLCEGFGEGARN